MCKAIRNSPGIDPTGSTASRPVPPCVGGSTGAYGDARSKIDRFNLCL